MQGTGRLSVINIMGCISPVRRDRRTPGYKCMGIQTSPHKVMYMRGLAVATGIRSCGPSLSWKQLSCRFEVCRNNDGFCCYMIIVLRFEFEVTTTVLETLQVEQAASCGGSGRKLDARQSPIPLFKR